MKVKFTKIYHLLFLFSLLFQVSKGQDPCSIHGCQNGGANLPYAEQDTVNGYAEEFGSKPFLIAAINSVSQKIDTSFFGAVWLKKVSGPGTLGGTLNTSITKYGYINDLSFSKAGLYAVEIQMAGLAMKDTIYFKVLESSNWCKDVNGPGCTSHGGDRIYPSPVGVVSVDAVFPILVGLLDSETNKIDSLFNGSFTLTQTSGPGNLNGTTTASGNKWVNFTDISFDQAGTYTVNISISNNYPLVKDTMITIDVVASNTVLSVGKSEFILYPNPGNGVFKFVYSDLDQAKLLVYNLLGEEVVREENLQKGDRLNISDLDNGLYFVKVVNNGVSQTIKYLKK